MKCSGLASQDLYKDLHIIIEEMMYAVLEQNSQTRYSQRHIFLIEALFLIALVLEASQGVLLTPYTYNSARTPQ
jgi:hypothetical protein